MIGIIGAMASEVRDLKAELSEAKLTEKAGITFYSGKLCGKDVVVACSGVGKVNAALCAQNMINLFNVSLIINTGVGAGVGDGVKIGDMVIAKDAVQHDMDTVIFGEPRGYIGGLKMIYIKADEEASKRLAEIAEKTGTTVHIGTVASGDQFISNEKVKQDIKETFNASAVEMEGAAIAHACCMNKVPFAILRSVSDDGSDEALGSFEEFVEEVNKKNIKILKEFLNDTKD